LLAPAEVVAQGVATLDMDEPWNTTGENTGNVGTTAVAAESETDSFNSTFSSGATYGRSDLFGSLALPGGTTGDFFTFAYSQVAKDTDKITVTLGGPLSDPIFYITDIDVIGASVTVAPTPDLFTHNVDGMWTGNTLSAVSSDSVGAFGAVQYLGLYDNGSPFTFDVDYTPDGPGQNDWVGIGIGVIPEPSSAALLALGLLGLAAARKRTKS
jgi:hypothetical protein